LHILSRLCPVISSNSVWLCHISIPTLDPCRRIPHHFGSLICIHTSLVGFSPPPILPFHIPSSTCVPVCRCLLNISVILRDALITVFRFLNGNIVHIWDEGFFSVFYCAFVCDVSLIVRGLGEWRDDGKVLIRERIADRYQPSHAKRSQCFKRECRCFKTVCRFGTAFGGGFYQKYARFHATAKG